jgi:hypothetical protein
MGMRGMDSIPNGFWVENGKRGIRGEKVERSSADHPDRNALIYGGIWAFGRDGG